MLGKFIASILNDESLALRTDECVTLLISLSLLKELSELV